MGDAFYRWDGFRYHSSFSDYLPSVALVSILWSIVAVLTSIMTWILVKAVERLLQSINSKIKAEHIFLFLICSGAVGSSFWIANKFFFGTGLSNSLILLMFFCVIPVALSLTWLFRNKLDVIQERITPLVWLFGIFILISIPLVAYKTWWVPTYDGIQQKSIKSSNVHLDRPNIILITFDALTTENMSLYGYDRLTTPFISRWAKGASVFTRAEAASCWTPPTVASLMLGKRVWTHQLYHSEGGAQPVKASTENLPILLQENGYTTMAFILNQMHASPQLLDISHNFHIAPRQSELSTDANNLLDKIDIRLAKLFLGKIKMYEWIIHSNFIFSRIVNKLSDHDEAITMYPPQKAFKSFLRTIDDNPRTPFFTWFHLYPPHHPYLPPEPYMGMFDSSSGFRTRGSHDALIMFSTARINQYHPNQDVQQIVNTLRARYDEFIRFADKQFEDFINQLQKRDELSNTIIILSSDHGESFEHDFVGHNGLLYEEQTHIPLIIKEPQSEGKIIDDLVEQIDITATILDLAHIQIPPWMEGRSLVPLLRNKSLSSKPVYSMNFPLNMSRGHQISVGTISVRDGDYKLMHSIDIKKSRLFNLIQDPDELNNLFDKNPEVGKRLLSLIEENLEKANERIRNGE
jgi:arylsulfatase A-like enzyme